MDRPEGQDATEACSYIAALDAETILALPDELLALFPEGYAERLSLIDQNAIAQALVAEQLSGQTRERVDVPLPDEWRVEAPEIVTFSFSDIPLAAITINTQTLTESELEAFVSDVLSPRIRELGPVARVEVDGGEVIPASLREQARELEASGQPDGQPAPANATSTTEDATEAEAGEAATPAPAEAEAAAAQPGEAPALPPIWGALTGQVEGVETLDTADDLFELVGTEISGVEISSVADLMNELVVNETARILLDTGLTPEILQYLAENEAGFYENLSPDFLAYVQENQPMLLEALPDDLALPAESSLTLPELWQQLSTNPLMQDRPLQNVEDLQAAGAVETLTQILAASRESGLEIYALELIYSLTPEIVAALVGDNPDFLSDLAAEEPDGLTFFSRPVLESDAFAEFIASTDDATLAEQLQSYVDGAPTVSEERLAALEADEEAFFVDPEAPLLPPSWPPVAGFIGASELDTADDIFNLNNYEGAADLLNSFAASTNGQGLVRDLPLETLQYLATNEARFWENLSGSSVRLLNPDIPVEALPTSIQNRLETGGDVYAPETTITRTNQNPSLVISIFKNADANTVEAWDLVSAELDELDASDDVAIDVAFEQATFITDSLDGVVREGSLGAILAVIMILIFMNLSFRSTLVTSVSIPGSVMIAFVFIYFVPGTVYDLLAPLVDDIGRNTTLGSILVVLLRLFPENITINIMTLSGLTVGIGRVVDDSIVVLENIYRNIQQGTESKLEAILRGTREMSVAIFAATLTTMLVFLPLGLFGGVVGRSSCPLVWPTPMRWPPPT
ncbi:MAG: efflux RND transporter permease subunit [Anaerolineae bacterium]|nr:efflux RND transporter permease subunit [Anaerolineae bacterium]